ncbi:MAG: PHP domain-containing protein [Oscillospiraceae bacterium]|nr:PHP domain-containing protein [Oscillospiraceae bacterium]
MKFSYDHDLHIHTMLSSCSADLEQTPERILRFAEEKRLKTICVTDHFWDEAVPGASEWYVPQNFPHINKSNPLPRSGKVKFLFGCEAEMDKAFNISISKEKYELFDFIIVSTTHLHRVGFTVDEKDIETPAHRARIWVKRLEAVLAMELPFHKVGIAHLTCKLIAPTREEYLKTLELLSDEEMSRLFKKAAKLGVGIELNSGALNFRDEEADTVLRPYRIARNCGCKFYCGSDAHHPNELYRAGVILERAIDMLDLDEKNIMDILL